MRGSRLPVATSRLTLGSGSIGRWALVGIVGTLRERPLRTALPIVATLALLGGGATAAGQGEVALPPIYDASADTSSPIGWRVGAASPGPEWASTTERPGRDYMTERITRSGGPVYEGRHGYRMETRGSDYGRYEDASSGSERAELANGNPLRAGFGDRLAREGDDLYYGFAIYLPRRHVFGRWQVYWQSKSVAPAGSPESALHVQDGQWQLDNNDEPSTNIRTSSIAPATRGVWHRFVIRIRYSSDYSQGVQEVWHAEGRGAPLGQEVSVRTHTLEAGKPSHVRLGYYHSALRGRTSRAYVDGFRAGRSFSSVAP